MTPMDRIAALLTRAFRVSDGFQQRLSARWREHSNRRTTIVLIVIGTALTLGYVFLVQPPESFPTGELVIVQDGDSVREITDSLREQGVVRSPLVLRLSIVALGSERSIHAGDYLFREPKDVFAIARALSVGAFGLEPVRIRIPEGATTRSMANIFQSSLLRFDASRFLEEAQPLEGFLFPDTYFFQPNASEELVIRTMQQTFDERMAGLMPDIEASGHTLAEVITMASIIEREAHVRSDRRMISGVLWNRIEKGMPLQVDVTFLYTLGKNTFQLTMEDLTSDSPYNTYVHKGLPPTPIGSPSLDAIDAAIHPTENDYLFYLADREGVTHFSKTYAEHLRKKRLYLGS